MRPDSVRLPENLLFPEGTLRPDLAALRTAKAKQDVSHQKLDRWIAAAIAELSDTATRNRRSPSKTVKPSKTAKTRGGTGKP